MNKKRELVLSSNNEAYNRVEKFVEEITDEYLLHDSYFGNILVALMEAVENAIIHGNRQDAGKKVHMMLVQKREGLWITVTDEGDGFDFNQVLYAESLDENSEKTGLLMIKRIADEVRFRNKGRVIDMLFRIYGIEETILERRHSLVRDFLRKSQPQFM